jgi:hypothetical protein
MKILFIFVTSNPSAKNIPDVDIAMKKMRSINGYLESGTQTMSKFLIF